MIKRTPKESDPYNFKNATIAPIGNNFIHVLFYWFKWNKRKKLLLKIFCLICKLLYLYLYYHIKLKVLQHPTCNLSTLLNLCYISSNLTWHSLKSLTWKSQICSLKEYKNIIYVQWCGAVLFSTVAISLHSST